MRGRVRKAIWEQKEARKRQEDTTDSFSNHDPSGFLWARVAAACDKVTRSGARGGGGGGVFPFSPRSSTVCTYLSMCGK